MSDDDRRRRAVLRNMLDGPLDADLVPVRIAIGLVADGLCIATRARTERDGGAYTGEARLVITDQGRLWLGGIRL